MGFCCSGCGHRQDGDGRCAVCGEDGLLDLRSQRVRELLEDIDSRLADKRNARIRMVGVVAGIAIVIAAALFVPPYRHARGTAYPGLPMFADQIIFMILIALGVIAVLERTFKRRRFPFLESLPPAELP